MCGVRCWKCVAYAYCKSKLRTAGQDVFKLVGRSNKVYVVDQYFLENFSSEDYNWKELLKGILSLEVSSPTKLYILVRKEMRDRLTSGLPAKFRYKSFGFHD